MKYMLMGRGKGVQVRLQMSIYLYRWEAPDRRTLERDPKNNPSEDWEFSGLF